MDRKTIIAVALCVLFLVLYRPLLQWLGLAHYLEPPRQQVAQVDTTQRDTTHAAVPAPPPSQPPPSQPAPTPPAGEAEIPASPSLATAPVEPAVEAPEHSVEVETPLCRLAFSNHGARLLWVELKRYASDHGASDANGKERRFARGHEVPAGDRVMLAGGPLFGVDLGSGEQTRSLAKLTYASAESLDAAGDVRVLTFTGASASGLHVRQTYRFQPDSYAIDLEVEISGVSPDWRIPDYSLTFRSWPLITEDNLTADVHSLRATSLVGTNLHREGTGSLLKGAKTFEGSAQWAGVQSRYFIGAAAVTRGPARSVVSSADKRPLPQDVLKRLPPRTKPDQDVAINSLVMSLPSAGEPVQRFVLYVGPCEYHLLSALKLHLDRAVDLGWTWVLPFSKLLLQLLNWLFGLFRNYGVAIVVLATLVRVLLHPLNMVSMRSMRAMQKLQPEMQRLKDKYKNDPQAMNAAVMALYKENKVNPAGGCLPMLIQMPLFVALYQVLYRAIELRQAPFIGWMNDLSAPDLLFSVGGLPVRLLPILMMGSGFLSQRLTPSDPRQLPTMYLMNVMMLVFFYSLPSGLVLYWTVMNLLTALQQWLVLRQDGTAPVVAPVTVRQGKATTKKARTAGR